jgi:uracil-DNA glycosylase family 4
MNAEGTTPGSSDAAQALRALQDGLRDCSDCELHQGRTQVVFGVGSPEARLMFVGEGPGFHEDKQGEPFVGQAGKFLSELLGSIGLTRGDVYIANVVKCRPPENRDPAPAEIEACSPKLMEQIAVIRPRVICTLGRFATKLLAETELSMTAIHGKAKEKELAGVSTIIFPVFHPAAALYNPANRQVLQDDFAKLRRLLERGMASVSAGSVVEEKSVDNTTGDAAPSQVAPSQVAPPQVAPPQVAEYSPSWVKPGPARTEQLPLW